ncbi:holo-ACP synthase [Marinospirillum alkaliphilum]|uniref:Holo-[acyl-carrier-protein] synthase n=1 Tax=Marinospirillum alkaliphilum DSM 21637 TaxID=1122209 RepID=A0A1K1YMM5_9GAMM|nr:holo-ACP synthase [Marinospirillum alkaliphilum]SFX62604.1 holo-[acyl-carrier protein] synthase [Marinospirillum alkaliphilum DSM 21637]
MLLGIGTDLARIERFEALLQRRGDAIARRLLTPTEQQAMQQAASPAAYLAKRFAAKEALLKALGTGLRDGLSWQQLEVSNDALGKPLLQLSGKAAELAAAMGVQQIHLSISDERDMALAFVVLEG